MSIIDTILSVIAPHYCLSCGVENTLLCQGCSQQMRAIPARCYRCHKLRSGYRTCTSCRSSSNLYAVMAVTVYISHAKELVGSLKFNGAQAAANDMVREMAHLLEDGMSYVVVPVPTTTDRVRYRGYDQAVLLARRLSRVSDNEYWHGLQRHGRTHQVGASRRVRLQQLHNAFYVSKSSFIRNKNILLVDDVCTTGATLEAAAQVLRRAGAKRVSAIVYAQA